MAKDIDRQRLRGVEQTDITEGRLNEDFVYWLKTSGPTWLLAILVGVTAYLGWVKWQQYKSSQRNQAWIDLASAEHPESLEELAETHAGTYAVPLLALESAADQYLNAVVKGRDFGDDPATAPPLTDEQRTDYLAKADRLYESVITKATAEKSDDRDTLLHAVYATFGRAAVAESRGDTEAARKYYDEAAERAKTEFPALAAQAKSRAASVDQAAKLVFLPSVAELPVASTNPAAKTPLTLDPALEPLIDLSGLGGDKKK